MLLRYALYVHDLGSVGIVDVAVTVRDQDDGHAQRIVALREVGARNS